MAQGRGNESARVYIGNIPYLTTADEVQALFQPYGGAENVNVVIDPATGKSKGFAFADLLNPANLQEAIDGLGGLDVGGRNIIVDRAGPRKPRS